MLTPEQAQQKLKAAQIPELETWRLKNIAMLSDEPLPENIRRAYINALKPEQEAPGTLSLRGIAYGVIGRKVDGKNIESETRSAYELQSALMHGSDSAMLLLPAEKRIQVFQAFFPKVAHHIEQLWQFIPTLPYQASHMRQGYRAPGHPELYDNLRLNVLHRLMGELGTYNEDIIWFAEHAAYFHYGYYADILGRLFAAIIEVGDAKADELFHVLLASARGEHEVGAMGRHVTRTLLTSSSVEGWQFVEKLLLAAQREEGLRQVVLETIDEAHPEAFRHMLHVILDNDLSRFSAVTRALNVWFGYTWDSENTRVINNTLQNILTLIEDEDARLAAIQKGTGESVYLGLCAIAVKDAYTALDAALPLLNDPDTERRFAAVHLLIALNIDASKQALTPSLADPDLRIALSVCYSLHNPPAGSFDLIEALLNRLPKGHDLPLQKAIVWPWQQVQMRPDFVAHILFKALEDRSPKLMLPYFEVMNTHSRIELIHKLVEFNLNDPEIRGLIFKSLAEREQYMRNTILKILKNQNVQPEESLYLESLLTRKSGDLRRGVMGLLCRQPDADVLASADRLITSGKVEQRQGGWEMLLMMYRAARSAQACVDHALAYRETHPKLSAIEESLIESIAQLQSEQPTLYNALGLMNSTNRCHLSNAKCKS